MAKTLLDAGLTFPQLFLVVGLMNAAVAAYIYMLVPEFLMRFVCWLLIHTFYRLEKSGLENIPDEGPAVLVCNHVSFVDPLVILAASPRPIRFVMDHRIFKMPVVSFVFRTGKAIPIAPAKEDEKLLEAAYDEVSKALRAGELVAIFPEGRITDTGEINPFRSGSDPARAARAVGQLLQPARRRRDDEAVPARDVLEDRAGGGTGGGAVGGDARIVAGDCGYDAGGMAVNPGGEQQ